jgi:hypothetical protein
LASGNVGAFFKLIYIVRDPRDVAISAAHHFPIDLFEARLSRSKRVATLKRGANHSVPHFVKLRMTINAVLHGDPAVNFWLTTPWREHYRQFQQSDALVVRYEDLLDEPETRCAAILSYLGVERSSDSIARAIADQSFEKRKRDFRSQGLTAEYEFLRRGSSGYWREELTRRQKQRFVDELGDELAALSYAVS